MSSAAEMWQEGAGLMELCQFQRDFLAKLNGIPFAVADSCTFICVMVLVFLAFF